MTNSTPEYLRIPVPPLHRHLHDISKTKLLKTISGKTDRYLNTFYPNTVKLWNDLSPSLRLAKSISVFKQNILKTYRPVKKSIFNIYEPKCIKWIFQLRVGLSPLKSHKKDIILKILLMIHVTAQELWLGQEELRKQQLTFSFIVTTFLNKDDAFLSR